MKKQTLKKMWACLTEGAPPDFTTISRTREGSIQKFLDNLDYPDQWSYYFFLGWDCFEVDITFEPCTPETP